VSRARAAFATLAAGAFAALAALVAHGSLTSLDEWAVHHAMPEAHFTGGKPTLVEALVPLWDSSWHGAVAVTTNLVTLPAAFLISTAIVASACFVVRGGAAVAFAAAYVAGNVVEELTKETLTRPALFAHGLHLAAFDNSFPSGHTIRGVFVAVAVACVWPRAWRWAVLWAASSMAMLELGAQHVPSDIAGGLLLGAGLAATTWSWWSRGRTTSRRPSPASRPSARAR
jgi:membrane-associated phospholipid phosphatase